MHNHTKVNRKAQQYLDIPVASITLRIHYMFFKKYLGKDRRQPQSQVPKMKSFTKHGVHLHPPDPVEDDRSLPSFNWEQKVNR